MVPLAFVKEAMKVIILSFGASFFVEAVHVKLADE
jgi:hypothetical protein